MPKMPEAEKKEESAESIEEKKEQVNTKISFLTKFLQIFLEKGIYIKIVLERYMKNMWN